MTFLKVLVMPELMWLFQCLFLKSFLWNCKIYCTLVSDTSCQKSGNLYKIVKFEFTVLEFILVIVVISEIADFMLCVCVCVRLCVCVCNVYLLCVSELHVLVTEFVIRHWNNAISFHSFWTTPTPKWSIKSKLGIWKKISLLTTYFLSNCLFVCVWLWNIKGNN